METVTQNIIGDVKFDEILIKMRTVMKEQPGTSISKAYDKAFHGFKMQWSHALRKFKKSRPVIMLRDKLILKKAEEKIEENKRFITLSRFEAEDVIKREIYNIH